MKKFIGISSGTLYLLIFSNFAFAASLCPSQYSGLCSLDVGKSIGSLINFAYLIAIIAALFYLIWGGFKWLTSGGDKAAVAQARDHLVSAVLGLIIIFLSYLILSVIAKFFLGGSFSLNNITIPTFGQ